MTKQKNKKEATETKGLKLEPHQVILKPMLTEKGMYQSEQLSQYTFKINPVATKTDVKNAIESLFEVEVAKVATQTRKGKPRRYRFRYGRTKPVKKAIVTLKGDHKIDFF